MGKLHSKDLAALLKKPRRHADGQGLFFRTLSGGRAYWVYRYRLHNLERETSLGPFPGMSLDDARAKHAGLRALVLNKIDPVGERRSAKVVPPGGLTFGQCADQYLDQQERLGRLRNRKNEQQWRSTLANLPASFRDLPVSQITPLQVYEALNPIWRKTPETASRLRGRIEIVLDSIRGPTDMHMNPADWSGWLKRQLGDPKKLGKLDPKTGLLVARSNHPSMPYGDIPAFMLRLAASDNVAAKALMFTILTAASTSQTINMTWSEIDWDKALWTIPAVRMKMRKEHQVPLSRAVLDILRAQHEARGKNPHVFAGRPQRPLSPMAMNMLLRRLKVKDATVHGMRASARTWMGEHGIPKETAEACLAHSGGDIVKLYQRSVLLTRRRPVMEQWGSFAMPYAHRPINMAAE